MRRSHCSRSLSAMRDSLISIERVCDAMAPVKSARCRSITPRKNHFVGSLGSNSVAMRACNSASFSRSNASRSRAASKCAAADLSLINSAAFASATFFAYCHMINGDVKVDFFTHNLAPPRVALLDAAGSFLVGALGTLLAVVSTT